MNITFIVRNNSIINWRTAYWTLFISWLLGAILYMNHFYGEFLTNYLADLTFPAWFYIYIRGLTKNKRILPRLLLVGDWFGRTPERALISIFIVGTLAELKTYFSANGPIAGTFDLLDILAYAVGLALCYFFDKLTVDQYSTE